MKKFIEELKEAAVFAVAIISINLLIIMCGYIDWMVIHDLKRITH